MNNILKIYSEISEKDKLNFISSCYAKKRNLFGCPRLIIKKQINKESIRDLFYNHNKFFQIDSKFFPLINNDFDELENLNIKILFDICQFTFDQKDELSEFLDEDIKKHYNLNIRKSEQEKFILTNKIHYDTKKTICEKVIFEKLNEIWKHRWSDSNSYINSLNRFNIMI